MADIQHSVLTGTELHEPKTHSHAQYALTNQTMYIGTTGVAINRASAALTLAGLTLTTPDIGTPSAGTLTNCSFPTLNQNTTGSSASCTGNAATVTNATLTTALTVNTGTVTLTGHIDNDSVLTIGKGAVDVFGSNTGDQDLSGYALIGQTMYIGTTAVAINRTSDALTLAGITLTTPDIGTPSAGTLTNCTFPTLNQNTSGTAANLSGTPDLPDGTTATTQSASDNSTKLATTAYVDDAISGGGATIALDNLSSVAINESLISDTDNTDDLGSATYAWKDLYLAGHIIGGDGSTNPTNLLTNGGFELWSAGTSAAPDGWAVTGGSVQRQTSTFVKSGLYSAELTGGAETPCQLYQQFHTGKGIDYWKGRTVTLGCWVNTTGASRARFYLSDGVTPVYSSFHSGSGFYEWLTATITVDSNATVLQATLFVIATGVAYFDGAMCVEGSSAFAFADRPAGEGVWTNYSATSTIVGWAAGLTKSIYTKKIGKTVFVSYSIAGTSNAATASFTVPYTIASPNFYSVSGYASDAGGNPVAGNIVVVAGGVAIDLRKDATTNAAWTASGTKVVLGRFSYESA